jgi:proteic killer suppression protein
MLVSFRNRGTEDVFDGVDSRAARQILPAQLHARAGRVMDRLNAAASLNSLRLPGLRLEKLRGDRAGQYSVRINRQYRVCFRWTPSGPADLEITDYH